LPGPRIAVVADSACDLPETLAERAGIRIVPLTVAFGTESFLDRTELSPEAFWDRVSTDPRFPTTASPAPRDLAEAYRAEAGAGATGVVSIHLSGTLSRTLESARQAASASPVPVEVVDTRSVSMGQGLVALAAAGAAAAHHDLSSVAERARAASARLDVVAVLDSVDFLKRGGRLGRARAALSDLLRIRPVLALERGEPVLVARPRTRRRAMDEAIARVGVPAEAAAVFHARSPDASEAVARLREACGVDPEIGLIGAVTGAHLGPRAIGLAVLELPERSLRPGNVN
jgi:DegV family protein with EDD domain